LIRRTLLAAVIAAAASAATSTDARADERQQRQVGVHRRDGWLGISVSLRDLFGPRERERLRSGFVMRVVIHADLWREGDKQRLLRQDRSTEIIFDLWDERFRVKVVERAGPTEAQVATTDEAVELATTLRNFPLIPLQRVDARSRYFVRLIADLNPLTEDLVADVRRWLVRSPGQGRTGTGDSVFGSFVNIFVNPRIEESERQISLWSQAIPGGAS
jgi:hypothetical protein